MKPDNKKSTRKTILLIAGAVVLVVILAVATAVILKQTRPAVNSPSNQDGAAQAKQDYDKAQELLAKGDLPAARSSFKKAHDFYKRTNDSAHLKEIDAALSLIDHTDDQATPTQEAPAVSKPATP